MVPSLLLIFHFLYCDVELLSFITYETAEMKIYMSKKDRAPVVSFTFTDVRLLHFSSFWVLEEFHEWAQKVVLIMLFCGLVNKHRG
jgi:hypothetical protein